MSDFVTTATDNQFYSELINRFFHSKSYFYACITKYLENPSLSENNTDSSIIQLLSRLIKCLNEAKQPVRELNEITLIKGFENAYSNLEMQLIRYDLRSLEQPQLKKAIQNIAVNFLEDIYQVLLKNENGRNTLTIYLKIKAKLTDILNGSNGKHKNKNLKHSPEYTANAPSNDNAGQTINLSSNTLETIPIKSLPEDDVVDSINNIENYSEKEITRLLKPLTIFLNKTSEYSTNLDFIKRIHDNFCQIQELAMYHGYEDIEAIAMRVGQLMLSMLSMKQSINQQIIGLIYAAKAAIEKYIIHHQRIDNLSYLLNSLDHCIADINNPDKTQQPKNNDSISLSESENEVTTSFEINPAFHNIEESASISTQEQNSSSIFPGFKSEEIFRENIDGIKLMGEDDEELLKLIQEVKIQKVSSLPEHVSEIEDVDNNAAELANSVEDSTQENPPNMIHDVDAYTNDIFQHEAILYYKILLGAVLQLKNEEKIQGALEDIELASSSLKHLALKFGMEKLALLPELMESISILANNHIIKLPSSILQGIEDGVILLKEFDINNSDHKTKFMSVLTLLKEYYSKTFKKTKKILITP